MQQEEGVIDIEEAKKKKKEKPKKITWEITEEELEIPTFLRKNAD